MDTNLKICTSLQSQESHQVTEAMGALLKTDDFLMTFLNYLNHTQDVLSDPFLTNWEIISNIVEYSSRNPYIHTLADSFADVVRIKMTEEDYTKFEQAKITPPSTAAQNTHTA